MKYNKSERAGGLATCHVNSMFDRVLEHKHDRTFKNRTEHLIYLLKQATLYTIGSSITDVSSTSCRSIVAILGCC